MASVTNNALNREIGEVKSKMEDHDKRLVRIEEKVDKLVDAVAQSRGGLRVVLSLSAVIGGVAAGISEIVHWFSRH